MFERMYFNVVCEEMSVFGGKIIHVDENAGNLDEVHDIVLANMNAHPNAKWELYPMIFKAAN